MRDTVTMPALRRAWLAEIGIEHVWQRSAGFMPVHSEPPGAPEPGGSTEPTAVPMVAVEAAATQAIAGLQTPAATPLVEAVKAAEATEVAKVVATPVQPEVTEAAASSVPTEAIAAAATSDATDATDAGGTVARPVPTETTAPQAARVPAGELVCRVYHAGADRSAWLVVVDHAELGGNDSGQRLFLGRILRALGLRRTDVGMDIGLWAQGDVLSCAQPVVAACGSELPVAMLLVGARAGRAVLADGAENGSYVLQERRVPFAVLPGLNDVAVNAVSKAMAWHRLCELRSRAA